jgi:hypothetical protein
MLDQHVHLVSLSTLQLYSSRANLCSCSVCTLSWAFDFDNCQIRIEHAIVDGQTGYSFSQAIALFFMLTFMRMTILVRLQTQGT